MICDVRILDPSPPTLVVVADLKACRTPCYGAMITLLAQNISLLIVAGN